MEDIDRKILALVATDGRISYTDIGRETGLSTSAAQQRVRRLEQRGVITGYRAEIDPLAIGRVVTAFISVQPFDPSEPAEFPRRIEDFPEIVSCYSMAGEASYLVKVQCEGTAELERLLAQIRSVGRVATHTSVVLSVPFEDRPHI